MSTDKTVKRVEAQYDEQAKEERERDSVWT